MVSEAPLDRKDKVHVAGLLESIHESASSLELGELAWVNWVVSSRAWIGGANGSLAVAVSDVVIWPGCREEPGGVDALEARLRRDDGGVRSLGEYALAHHWRTRLGAVEIVKREEDFWQHDWPSALVDECEPQRDVRDAQLARLRRQQANLRERAVRSRVESGGPIAVTHAVR